MNITQAMTYLWIKFLFDISLFSLKHFLEILYYEICVVKKYIYFISFHIKLNFTVAFLLIRMTNLPVRWGMGDFKKWEMGGGDPSNRGYSCKHLCQFYNNFTFTTT